MFVSVDIVLFLCFFVGCVSSAIVSLSVIYTYLEKGPELAVCKRGIHVAGGAPKRKCTMESIETRRELNAIKVVYLVPWTSLHLTNREQST